MKTRQTIIGNRIFLEIVVEEGDDAAETTESAVVIVDLVPNYYGEL